MAQRQRGLTSVQPGDRVRLTGYFLAATGQRAGGEGHKTWTVLACDCALCRGSRFCKVDERYSERTRAETWGDLPEAERPTHRHVNLCNLERVGAPPRAADQSDALPPIKTWER